MVERRFSWGAVIDHDGIGFVPFRVRRPTANPEKVFPTKMADFLP